MNSNRSIIRGCKARGWTIQPSALMDIETVLQSLMILNEMDNCYEEDDSMGTRIMTVLDNLVSAMKQQNLRTVTSEVVRTTFASVFSKNDTEIIKPSSLFVTNEKQNPSLSLVETTLVRPQSKSTTATTASSFHKQGNSHYVPFQNTTNNDDINVINAFETPRLTFDRLHNQFSVDETKKRSLFGEAEDKINMLVERYCLIQQRILRNPLFRPTNFSNTAGGRACVQHKLTPIESLLGGGSTIAGAVIVLGILIQIEEGQYYLEDLTGQVPVMFQPTVSVEGFFVTEYCILLVEGIYHDGVFFIDRLGHPLLEERNVTLQAIEQQVSHPYFKTNHDNIRNKNYNSPPTTISINGERSQYSKSSSLFSFVILSDVYLDQPRVLQQLEALFASYERIITSNRKKGGEHEKIPVFILMGNFVTTITHQSLQQQWPRTANAIDDLVTLIERFPKLTQHAHFCLVAGPHDYSVMGQSHLHVLPLPALDTVMKHMLPSTSKIRNFHYGSNPCRIRCSGREIVIFRYDLLHLIQHYQVLQQQTNPKSNATTTGLEKEKKVSKSLDNITHDDDDDDDDDSKHHLLPHCRLVKTILDQGHLLPVANIPIYWNFDAALRLYPLPDALILGGDGPCLPFHEIYGECDVIHPGSFESSPTTFTSSTLVSMGSNYAVYSPGSDDLPPNDSEDDESKSSENVRNSNVTFMQVGRDLVNDS